MNKKKKTILSVVGFFVSRNSYLEFKEKRHQERMDNYGDNLIQNWQGSNSYKY